MNVTNARLLQECAEDVSEGAAAAASPHCISGVGAFHAAGWS